MEIGVGPSHDLWRRTKRTHAPEMKSFTYIKQELLFDAPVLSNQAKSKPACSNKSNGVGSASLKNKRSQFGIGIS